MNSREERVEQALTVIFEQPPVAGLAVPITRFEEVFGLARDNKVFGLLISEFRRALYARGFYLSGENSSETGVYEILDPRENQWVAQLAMAKAERDLIGKKMLLDNTDLTGFSKLQRLRHENTARAISLRVVALQKAEEIADILQKKKPKRIIDQGPEEEPVS